MRLNGMTKPVPTVPGIVHLPGPGCPAIGGLIGIGLADGLSGIGMEPEHILTSVGKGPVMLAHVFPLSREMTGWW